MQSKGLSVVLVVVLALSFLAGCAGGSPAAKEEPYPTKQLTYMIPFDPGGQSDREARRQQPYLEKILGQKVIIDYKVGGGGAVGWAELVRQKPDGYYFAGINIPHIILQPLQQDTGYKTEQIVPVYLFQRTPLGLIVLKTSPYQTLKDFLAAAAAKPGEITVGGSATFSGHHFTTLRLNQLAKVQLNYVPFTGSAPQMTAFLGGHVNSAMAASDDMLKNRDLIRVLAVASDQRLPDFPDAPTFKELGYDLIGAIDRGVGVPPGTPDYIVKKLESAFDEIMKNADIQAEMKKQGFVPLQMGSKESKAYIEAQTKIYTELAKGLPK